MPLVKLLLGVVGGYDDIRDELIETCKAVVDSQVPNTDVDIMCPGIMDLQGPHVKPILQYWAYCNV